MTPRSLLSAVRMILFRTGSGKCWCLVRWPSYSADGDKNETRRCENGCMLPPKLKEQNYLTVQPHGSLRSALSNPSQHTTATCTLFIKELFRMWLYSRSKNKWDCVICRKLRSNGKTGGGWDTEGKGMSHLGPVEACYQLKITVLARWLTTLLGRLPARRQWAINTNIFYVKTVMNHA